jgi:hypothetical protein
MSVNKFSVAALLALGAATAPASAVTIFDSRALGEPLCESGGLCETEQRTSDINYAAVLQFTANVTVNQIGVWSSVDDAQDVKFVIFDSLLFGGTGDLLFSQTKSYGVTAATWLYTDPMSFTFQAGKTYDVGILGNGRNLTGRWIAYTDLTSGPVTGIAQNANINNFGAPQTGGYAGVVPWVQLNTNVPEPASWAMMIVGFGLVGTSLRRRNVTVTLQRAA